MTGYFGQMPIAHHRLAAIGCCDIRTLVEQAFQFCLNGPGNQVTSTLTDQGVQRVVAIYLWL